MAYCYASTNTRLIGQMVREGYSDPAIIRVMRAYKLAITLFAGQFQRSGKSQIAHGVGTASMLCALGLPSDVVAAGIVHNAYDVGDFGDDQKGVTDSRRNEILDAVDESVEIYLSRFYTLVWNSDTIPEIAARVDSLNDIDRYVVLLRLADLFDHHSDFSRIYKGDIDGCKAFLRQNGGHFLKMAGKLGYPKLVFELKRTFDETMSADISPDLLSHICLPERLIVGPRSLK